MEEKGQEQEETPWPLPEDGIEGFAHGFLTLSDTAEFLYKTTNYYSSENERSICWDDLSISVDWRSEKTPLVSVRDAEANDFKNAEVFG